jgi:PAS domain S-box-containing protein
MDTSLRVLIVEDSEDDELLIIRELKKGGYNPVYERVETAAAMKKALKEKQWDIVLCDYSLPKFNAPSAIALLKEANIDIPLIVVSGTIGEDVAIECMHLGAQDYIMKGNKSRLYPAIARELEDAKVRNKQRQAESEREAALKSLRESEEKYRLIFEYSPLGLLSFDEKGVIVACNDNFVKIIGSSREKLIGLNMLNLPDKNMVSTVQKALKGSPGLYEGDYSSVTARKITPVRCLFAPMDFGGGRISGGVGIIEDITERKQTEEALRESEELYRTIFENTGTSMILIEEDMTISMSNGEFVRNTGYSSDEINGRMKWTEIIHPDDLGRMIEQHRLRRESQGVALPSYEFRYITKTGHLMDTLLTIKLVPGTKKSIASLIDITERKQAESQRQATLYELRESEDKYRTLIETTDTGYVIIDQDGFVLDANYEYVRLTGHHDLSEIVGRSVMDWTAESGKEKNAEAVKACFDKGYIRNLEIDYVDAKGNVTPIEINATCMEIEGKTHTITICRDITERKRAEEKLQHILDRLNKAVGTTIQVLVSAVESRDSYTAGHQSRSADLACAIATEMGLAQEKIEGIRMAGIIHDIGKLSIPAEILSKPTKLTAIEFSLIKEHARSGYEMLKDVESPWPLAEIVYQHHERMNGSGYPRNLKGDEILIESQILAVADVVEAMASHRPYRPTLGIEAALEEITKNKGILYNNVVAEACLRLFRENGYQLI